MGNGAPQSGWVSHPREYPSEACLSGDSNFRQVDNHNCQRLLVLLCTAFGVFKIHYLYFSPPTLSLLQSGLHLYLVIQTYSLITLEDFQQVCCIRQWSGPWNRCSYCLHDAITRQHLAQSHSSSLTSSRYLPWITSISPTDFPWCLTSLVLLPHPTPSPVLLFQALTQGPCGG